MTPGSLLPLVHKYNPFSKGRELQNEEEAIRYSVKLFALLDTRCWSSKLVMIPDDECGMHK